MTRKRITQIFPFLLPLRKMQRKNFFYIHMYFDKNSYAKTKEDNELLYKVFEAGSLLINDNSGFDLQYQINKVYNLKLAAKTVNNILIQPGETFSFWQLVKSADRYENYKDGLVLQDGKIVGEYGGGLCQLSNLVFWLLIHTPLTIVERHTHDIKIFSSEASDIPEATDATVSEGWLDLKVKNETNSIFQIKITFDDSYMQGCILTNKELDFTCEIFDRDISYYRKGCNVFQHVSIYQRKSDEKLQQFYDSLLYNNICEIGYQLHDDIEIIEKGE
ncbi:glycopeptide resistance accessory protein VanW [Clostridium sp. CM028]|uniref:glycopeptide resistance accessory protein VanW n=1 Tax=Clostridium sp. CM028 TaxID=2851575 RepID=UPI001C6EA468|nr:glycopeptide resistance accessory protein VanW [Clostridium sp. CM028]MBW9148592.1 glycopeptide resistance accessory protein VanW [Clostridium sp. CM028]WLC60812.1 glycopeptide resistance accessory protein VanW [Clostridium sp. CM028]